MAASTSSLATMCSGPRNRISIARWTVKINRTALPNPTREQRRGSGAIAETVRLRTSRRKPASASPHQKPWASPSSITTTTAGPTFCFQRHATEQAVPKQWQRHFLRKRRDRRRRLQRRWRSACRHGRGCRGLRSLRLSKRDDHEFLEPDAFALSQRRQRPVCRRSAAVRNRAGHAAHAGLRLLFLRLRPRRLARYFHSQWPHRSRNSEGTNKREVRDAATPLS